jgi:membrane-bound lytic murein transglycosylase A
MKNKYILIIFALGFMLLFAFFWIWQHQKKTEIHLNTVTFSKLPGWNNAQLLHSFETFMASCKVFLKMDPRKSVGSEFISLTASDWYPGCQAALQLNNPYTPDALRHFFQAWFNPVEFHDGRPVKGLFTGYYLSALKGSRTKTSKYNVPIFGLPDDIVIANLNTFDTSFKSRKIIGRVVNKHQLVPYYTRAEIDKGALKGKAPVIAWVDSKIDRLFLEIQGSGVIELADGTSMYVGYTAQNGAQYTAVAGVLIKQGVLTRDNASMQGIRRYLEKNPDKITPVLNQNKSFIFFEESKTSDAFGTQGVALTPGYSMAVDTKWVPLGAPIWLSTTRPSRYIKHPDRAFQRLMIAQDTGGAIRGPVRGDVYWGAGDRATTIAGRMKNPGHYWILLPNTIKTAAR